MKIRYLDMFAGAGGFRSGLAKVGDFFVPVGWCEIDKYAQRAYRALYDTGGEYFCEDARQINPSDLPDIDLICGGFPCQSFSIAGKRGGFSDARGTLFFEIARIAAAKRPACLLLENVPGLLSHDRYRTFATILGTLSELGYDVTWQILNSADFGVPQVRKRVYIVGFLREKCAGKILSFNQADEQAALQAPDDSFDDVSLPIKVKTKQGYQLAHLGDSIDLAYPNQNSRRGRVGEKVAHTVTPGAHQGCFFIDMNPPPTFTDKARCLTTRQNSGVGNHKGEKSGVFIEEDSPFAVEVHDKSGIVRHGRVRRLTPRECFRLQGYTDEQFDKLVAEGIPESQLYKLAGNSVTVNVVEAIGQFLVEEVL